MQVAKWGNSLAVRLPAELVRTLGLKEGDTIDLVPGARGVEVVRQPSPDEVLAGLRRFRGRLPAAARLTRDDAHLRGFDDAANGSPRADAGTEADRSDEDGSDGGSGSGGPVTSAAP